MKKKIIKIIAIIFISLSLTGCNKEEKTGTLNVYTSVYPTEYILDELYGNKLVIQSIYPAGTNYENFKLSSTLIDKYSNGDLYVYNGNVTKEKDYAVKMINKNKKLKIIDASQDMTYSNDPSEAWLNPSNFLMMASNIKKGLEEYINETVEIKTIENNYKKLKLELSEIDANLKALANNNPTLVVSNDSFKYLEKYGFKVMSIEENENLTDKTIYDVKKLFENKQVSYIFAKDDEKENSLVTELKNNYGAEVISLNSITTLSDEEKAEKNDYQSIMQNNISLIKKEITN